MIHKTYGTTNEQQMVNREGKTRSGVTLLRSPVCCGRPLVRSISKIPQHYHQPLTPDQQWSGVFCFCLLTTDQLCQAGLTGQIDWLWLGRQEVPPRTGVGTLLNDQCLV